MPKRTASPRRPVAGRSSPKTARRAPKAAVLREAETKQIALDPQLPMASHVRQPFQGYNRLLQNNPFPQLVLSHGGFVSALNHAAQRLLGRPAGEILGVPLSHFMDEPEAFRF